MTLPILDLPGFLKDIILLLTFFIVRIWRNIIYWSRSPPNSPPTPQDPPTLQLHLGAEKSRSPIAALVPVAASVGAIVKAYSDGADLVAQIRGKQSARTSSQHGSLQELTSQDLQASLNRGAQVVQRQFGRDATRFGEQYKTGYRIACEALKDVIIQLQSQMIVDLKRIQSYQETISDFSALQDVSDASQDRVILVLLQLQQRVIMAGPIEPLSSLPSFWDPNASSAKHHATPHNVDGSTATASMQSDAHSQETKALPHSHIMRTSSGKDVFRPPPDTQERNNMTSRLQGPSFETFLSPPTHRAPSPPPSDNVPRPSLTEKKKPKPRTSIFGSLGRNRKGPSKSSARPRSPTPSVEGNPDASGVGTQRPSRPRASTAASLSTQDASEHSSQTGSSSTGDNASILGDHQSQYSPLSTSDSHNMSHGNHDAHSFVSSSASRTSQETQSKRRSIKQPVAPSTITVITANQEDSPSATDLLPSEANKFSGFCKGAWRLQIGDHKKALQERQRPGSMYSSVRFWQCKSCKFEGRLIQPEKKTKIKDFDPQVMVAEGIQFRWVFLFKSHVECKDASPNPLRSTFGCVFCCAEGRGTPVFGGAAALMEHMQEHRIRLPVGEVLYRMNALVGEMAPPGADFEVNLDAKEGLTI